MWALQLGCPRKAPHDLVGDSGLRADEYCPHYDLLCPLVLFSLLTSIYGRAVTRLHLGPPCQTWGLLFQNLGPGTRSDARWEGNCLDEREIRGNRTMGAALLLLRAIWEVYGTATLEHLLTSRIWRLKAIRALLGLPGCRKLRIDQCRYNLRPGDDPTGKLRYLKPTGILLIGAGRFRDRVCDKSHPHTQVLGGYSIEKDGKRVSAQRSHEAGAYPRDLCRALGDFHLQHDW